MQIYGLDFTSAPSRRKPIVCIACEVSQGLLKVDRLLRIASLNEFEVFLKRPGPWIAGFDFPFGQPRKLVEALNWPPVWADYVEQLATISQPEFEDVLAGYRDSKPAGQKQPLRIADIKARALSPMMMYGIPVGKMFFRGAPRLLRTELSILPCRPTADSRVALEAYPALVARKWLGNVSYKSDDVQKQTADKEAARQDLLEDLCSDQLGEHYDLSLSLDPDLADMLILDPSGDSLDALLCAIQAAWAYLQPHPKFGIPQDSDPLEGWIIDPAML